MALTNVTDGNQAGAGDINQYKNHLEGGAGKTLAYKLLALASNDFIVVLPENGGVQAFSVRDSDEAEIFDVNSNGHVTLRGYLGLLITDTDGTVNGQMWIDDSEDLVKFKDSAGTVKTVGSPSKDPAAIKMIVEVFG